MSALIEKLQRKPYAARVRLLWGAVAACGIVIIAIWLTTLKYRKAGDSTKNMSKFNELYNDAKQLKDYKLSK